MKKGIETEIQDIQKGNIRPVYFLAGDDYFLQDYFIRELEKALKEKGELERSVWVPDAGDSEALIRELNGVPMFAQPRLFVVFEPARIRGKNREELLEACRSPGPDNVVVLVTDRLDSRRTLVRRLADEFGVVNTSTPFPEKLPAFVDFLFRQFGLEATDEAVDILLELCGDSLYHIANEIGKLEVNLKKGNKVKGSHILELSGWKRSFYPWQFLDAVGRRDFSMAVQRGMAIAERGKDMSMLISNLTGLFQELFFRHLSRHGRKEAGGKGVWKRPLMHLSPQIERRLPKYQELYGLDDVSMVLRLLARADRQLKSTRADMTSVFVPLIHRITRDHA